MIAHKLHDTNVDLEDVRGRGRFANHDILGLSTLALGLLFSGRHAQARQPIEAYLQACEDKSSWVHMRVVADMLALFAACEGRFTTAAQLQGYSDQARTELGRRSLISARAHEQTSALIEARLDSATIASHDCNADSSANTWLSSW